MDSQVDVPRLHKKRKAKLTGSSNVISYFLAARLLSHYLLACTTLRAGKVRGSHRSNRRRESALHGAPGKNTYRKDYAFVEAALQTRYYMMPSFSIHYRAISAKELRLDLWRYCLWRYCPGVRQIPNSRVPTGTHSVSMNRATLQTSGFLIP